MPSSGSPSLAKECANLISALRRGEDDRACSGGGSDVERLDIDEVARRCVIVAVSVRVISPVGWIVAPSGRATATATLAWLPGGDAGGDRRGRMEGRGITVDRRRRQRHR